MIKENDISLHKFGLILYTRARLITAIFAVAVAIAGVISYLSPSMYTATASLNFDFKGNPVDSKGRAELTERTYLTTQIGIIQSQNVSEKVEKSLTKYERERLIAALDAKQSAIDDLRRLLFSPIKSLFKDDRKSSHESDASEKLQVSSAYSWLARSLGSDLAVEPEFNSRIVRVSYSSTDPKVAALIVNRYQEAYIAANLQMTIDPARKSKVWFDEQLKSLRKRLEEAQARLTEYQQKEGIVSSDERLDTENARLQDLSRQLVEAQQATRNAVTEQQKLQEVLNSGASLMTFVPVFNNPVVQRIKLEIRDLEGQRVQSFSSLGENHPKMKKLNSEVAAARRRLQDEIKAISDGINNAAELSRERERDLAQTMEEQKQLVLSFKNEHDRIAVLEREVESTQATYNAALNQLNTTSMQSMVNQTNVSVVDAANIPGSRSSPRVTVNLALGAFAGLLLGIGTALFMEIFVRRVYSREDLLLEVGVPLLGHLKKV
jgi:uncharacterized protein involved in exopolysaccharide biosynthesis